LDSSSNVNRLSSVITRLNKHLQVRDAFIEQAGFEYQLLLII